MHFGRDSHYTLMFGLSTRQGLATDTAKPQFSHSHRLWEAWRALSCWALPGLCPVLAETSPCTGHCPVASQPLRTTALAWLPPQKPGSQEQLRPTSPARLPSSYSYPGFLYPWKGRHPPTRLCPPSSPGALLQTHSQQRLWEGTDPCHE